MKYTFCSLMFFLAGLQLYCQNQAKSIDSLLKTYYSDNEPGAFVYISKNNRAVFKKGYGLANMQSKEKISSTTNFNIGSLTKQFTAFCIVQLAERKQLSLQDKLVKYFPDFNPQTGNLVTIQQLLTHCSASPIIMH